MPQQCHARPCRGKRRRASVKMRLPTQPSVFSPILICSNYSEFTRIHPYAEHLSTPDRTFARLNAADAHELGKAAPSRHPVTLPTRLPALFSGGAIQYESGNFAIDLTLRSWNAPARLHSTGYRCRRVTICGIPVRRFLCQAKCPQARRFLGLSLPQQGIVGVRSLRIGFLF
jgi:hypothetical protein